MDAKYVYWTSQGTPGSVHAVRLAGGAVIPIASSAGQPYGIVVDPPANSSSRPPQFVYWTDFNDNNVMRAPIPGTIDAGAPGGAPMPIASGLNTPSAIAIDQMNVYFVNQGTAQILEVAK